MRIYIISFPILENSSSGDIINSFNKNYIIDPNSVQLSSIRRDALGLRSKNRLRRSTCARDQGKKINKKVTKAYISHMCRETPSGGFQPNLTHLEALPRLSIFRNFMTAGEGV
jgi:hypothetical protein